MTISAIQPQFTLMEAQNTNATNTQISELLSLENLVDPATQNSVLSFRSTVEQSILPTAPSLLSSESLQPTGNVVSNIIDDIQQERKKVAGFISNIAHLSPQEAVRLQETAENMFLSVQFLSKGLSLTTKAVDTLVRMQ